MKRFVWRLQQVLDIKIKEEKVKRKELIQLTEKLAQAQSDLLMRQKILKDIISELAEKKPHKRLSEQEFFLKYSAASDEQIRRLQNEIHSIEAEQRKKMVEAVLVKRFREGLERLRDEAKKRFMKEQEKIEQKELDEGNIMSFVRNKIVFSL